MAGSRFATWNKATGDWLLPSHRNWEIGTLSSADCISKRWNPDPGEGETGVLKVGKSPI